MRVSKKYLAPSIYSYPYWRLKSNIRFYKGVFCLFGHPHSYFFQSSPPVLKNRIINIRRKPLQSFHTDK